MSGYASKVLSKVTSKVTLTGLLFAILLIAVDWVSIFFGLARFAIEDSVWLI